MDIQLTPPYWDSSKSQSKLQDIDEQLFISDEPSSFPLVERSTLPEVGEPQDTRAWPEILGERVLRRRVALGWTQADLAKRMGVSVRYLIDIECGKRNPSVTVLVGLAFALGVSPAVLVDGFLPYDARRPKMLKSSPPHILRRNRRKGT